MKLLNRLFCKPKLYAFQPDGHGQYSFFVMAYSKADAKIAVGRHIEEREESDITWNNYNCNGWGSPYYKLTVLELGQVVENQND